MPHTAPLLAFAAVSLGMALTPGPNMIYLLSRSICQGRTAGLISLGGVALGFVFYMLCAAFGITALLLAVPYAYDALRFAGVVYLLWLAWQALKPGGRSPFEVRALPPDSPRKLFAMGFVTSMPNHFSEIFVKVPSASSWVIASSIALANFGLPFLNGMPDGVPGPTFEPVRSGNCEFFSRYASIRRSLSAASRRPAARSRRYSGAPGYVFTSMPGTDLAISI